jgi:hypothetical protein
VVSSTRMTRGTGTGAGVEAGAGEHATAAQGREANWEQRREVAASRP